MAAQDDDTPPPQIIVVDDALSFGGRLAAIVDRFNDSDFDPILAIRDAQAIFARVEDITPATGEFAPLRFLREMDYLKPNASRKTIHKSSRIKSGGRPSSAGAYKGSKAAKKATRPKKRPKGFNRRKGFRQ